MLQERNFYMLVDPVYKERQRASRVMEHKTEGQRLFRPVEWRPFGPPLAVGMNDEGWK